MSQAFSFDFESSSHRFMEGALNHLKLLFPGKTIKVHCITGNSNGKGRITFRVLHGLQKGLTIYHVYIQVMGSLSKISIQDPGKVRLLLSQILSQRLW